MLARSAAMAVLIVLASCAGMQSAGRSARTAEPAPVAPAMAAPAPAPVAPTSVAAPTPAPPPAASAPTPQPQRVESAPAADADTPVRASTRDSGEDVVVPGVRERQVPTPDDPRSTAERMQDIRAWDQCVMRVQSAFDRDPMRPQLESPEEYCRESLGMADRTAVPISRLEQRR